MNKWLVAIAFSVLLLVPVGAQNAYSQPLDSAVFVGLPDAFCDQFAFPLGQRQLTEELADVLGFPADELIDVVVVQGAYSLTQLRPTGAK